MKTSCRFTITLSIYFFLSSILQPVISRLSYKETHTCPPTTTSCLEGSGSDGMMWHVVYSVYTHFLASCTLFSIRIIPAHAIQPCLPRSTFFCTIICSLCGVGVWVRTGMTCFFFGLFFCEVVWEAGRLWFNIYKSCQFLCNHEPQIGSANEHFRNYIVSFKSKVYLYSAFPTLHILNIFV